MSQFGENDDEEEIGHMWGQSIRDCLHFLFRFIPTQTWDQDDAYKERNKILDQDILTIFKVVYKLGRGLTFHN